MKSDTEIGKDEVVDIVGTMGVWLFYTVVFIGACWALVGVGLLVNFCFEFMGIKLIPGLVIMYYPPTFTGLAILGLFFASILMLLYLRFEDRKKNEQIKKNKKHNQKPQKRKLKDECVLDLGRG